MATASAAHAEHADELAFLIEVDLAHHGVVPHVLFDGVFEIDAHATLSTARSLALRALGFAAISGSPGTVGRLVTSVTVPVGCQPPHRVLHDPVLERMERDDREPPAGPERRDRRVHERLEPVQLRRSPKSAAPETCASPGRSAASSARRRRAGPPRPARASCRARRGRARRQSPARPGAIAAPRRTARSRPPASPRPRRRADRPATSPCDGSMRMSSGPLTRKLNPRDASSSCIDDTPRSASTP